jgi:hypothetical protein
MGEAGAGGMPQACEHGRPLAAVFGQDDDAQPGSPSAIARSPAALPSVLPSTTTQTGVHSARAVRTVS